jgi:phospholipase C
VSLCGAIIRELTWLERQSEIVVSKVCRIGFLEKCADWKNEGHEECAKERDEGYEACAREEEQGYKECSSWGPFGFLCIAFTWVTHLACVAWTWVSHIVCVAWAWVSKWYCRLFVFIFTTICKLIVGVFFWFIRRTLLLIVYPCRFRHPKLEGPIKHVFVLMLENRSFDHMLGATSIAGSDAETHEATETVRRPDDAANDVRDENGNITNHCEVGTGQKRTVGKDPGHEFVNTLVMLCGEGPSHTYPPYPQPVDNSGFAQNFAATDSSEPCTIMLSYRGDDDEEESADVPVLAALAREFAVCDHWFSSMPGPTWPNRLFVHAASSAGLDDSPTPYDTFVEELVDGIIFEHGSVYELLDSENIDWSVYHGDHFPQVMALSGMDPTTIAARFHDMDDFEDDLAAGAVANYVFIEPNYGEDILENTFKCGNSQHPVDDITHGERLIKRVYEGIRNSPLWRESMLIVTYDEGGGFYDHMPPGAAVPPGDSVSDSANNYHDFDFAQLGVRVPAVVCSPWIPRNTIDHREYEHASVPSTVERMWGLPAMTNRDAHARDLKSLLSLPTPRTDAPTTLPEAAAPEVDCSDDARAELRALSLSPTRPPAATILDPVTQARVQQENPQAIASTAGAFFQLAVRRDLQLAPRDEHPAILAQARRFQTMGEVGAYKRKVAVEIERHRRTQPQQRDSSRTSR